MVLEFAILLALALIGWLLISAGFASLSKLEVIGLAYPIGAGAYSLALFILSIFLIPLSSQVFWLLMIFMVCGAAFIWWRRKDSKTFHFSDLAKPGAELDWGFIGMFLAVFLISGSALLVSIGSGYSSWDAAAIWAAKGYGISIEKSIYAAESWGAHGLAYPLNIPLQIATFQAISGDLLPASKAIFSFYLGSALLVLGGHAFSRKANKALAVGFIALLGTTPIVFRHGTVGYANLAFSSYLALGAIYGVSAVFEGRRDYRWLSGVLFGLAAWTRAEGIGFSLILILTLLALDFKIRSLGAKPFQWFIPFIAIPGPWLLISANRINESHLGGAVRLFLREFFSGRFNLWELYLIPRLFFDRLQEFNQWGYLFIICLATGALILGRLLPRASWERFSLLLICLLSALVTIGIFYVRSFSRTDDFIQLLDRSFDRALFPAVFLMVYTLIRAFPQSKTVDILDS